MPAGTKVNDNVSPAQAAAADGSADDSARTIWGRLATSQRYQSLSEFIFTSPRRQFILLAAFPIVWVLFTHLGPILQMLWISFLDAYPPSVDEVPQLTIANWASFFSKTDFFTAFLPYAWFCHDDYYRDADYHLSYCLFSRPPCQT